MTRFDTDVEMTLELARVAREPSVADRGRNFDALRARLDAAASEGSSGPAHVVPELRPSNVLHLRQPESELGTAPVRARAALHQLVLVGAVTGAMGFFLGLSFSPAPGVELMGQGPPLVHPGEPLETSAPSESIEASPAASPAVVAPSQNAAAQSPAPSGSGSEGASHAQGVKPRAKPQAKVTTRVARRDPRFLEALRLLQRAQRSLDAGEPALAMVLLDDLDARFPRELLGEERQATRVLAWCESGETDRAERAARVLSAQNPNSIYTSRIARSCAGFASK